MADSMNTFETKPYFLPKPVNNSRPTDGSMHFNVTKHPKEVLEIMNILRHTKKLCDITLTVGEDKFLAHKIVLSAASPYFKAMFTGGMKEEKMTVIPLHGILPCTMYNLIEFAYTAEIQVNERNVCLLLPAANMFQMTHVIEACCVFLEHQLDPSNCIGITDFASEHGCHELQNKARNYIYCHFTEVSKCDEFLQLSPCQLVTLIKHDELDIKCESEVFNAVMKWTKHEPEKRIPKVQNLLSAVRCHYLPANFIHHQLKTCDVLSPQCQGYLSKIFEELRLHKNVPNACRRKPCSPTVIFTAGGYLRQSLSYFECYNPKTKQWLRLPDLPIPRSGLTACIIKGVFYAVGGRNNSPEGNTDSPSLDIYDSLRNMWRPLSPMLVPRNRVGIGVIDNLLYAVGGSHGSQHHNTAER